MDHQTEAKSAMERAGIRVTPAGLVPRRGAAKYLDRKPKTLAAWEASGYGPRVIKIRGRAFYEPAELVALARGEAA